MLEPIASKDEVFAHIRQLLDEAKTHLLAGGDTFPFPLGSGFAGFDTPATFLKANRAIKARVDVYTGDNAGRAGRLWANPSSAPMPPMPNLSLGIYLRLRHRRGRSDQPAQRPQPVAHPSVRRGRR